MLGRRLGSVSIAVAVAVALASALAITTSPLASAAPGTPGTPVLGEDDPAERSIPPPKRPPNLWVRSGARPWTLCQELEEEAAVRLRRGTAAGEERGLLRRWEAEVLRCPHVPTALVLLAMLALASPPEVAPSADPIAGLVALGPELRDTRINALVWLDAAAREAERRGEDPPAPARYLAAYAALGLGDPVAARPRVDAARAAAEVESWRIDRLDALVALAAGDSDRALRLAHRAREHAAIRGRPASVYVLALVLDRSGSEAAARGLLRDLRLRDTRSLGGLVSLLPLHERLYLMALEQEARGHAAGADALWRAYLDLEGAEDPERAQVRRRLRELQPAPGP